MGIQIITIEVSELLGIINIERENAYSSGYIKAKKELESIKAEPKFSELLKGAKELKAYLEYKGYWKGSINTLNKIAPQLLEDEQKKGHILTFHCTCIDHAFRTGFQFQPWKKKVKR